jgi:hypothetical protein
MRLAILLLVLSLAGCLPYKRPDWVSIPLRQDQVAADSDDKLRIGEDVIVDTWTKKTYRFRIIRLEQAGFVGVAKDNKTYTMYYKDFASMWVKRWQWHVAVAR